MSKTQFLSLRWYRRWMRTSKKNRAWPQWLRPRKAELQEKLDRKQPGPEVGE